MVSEKQPGRVNDGFLSLEGGMDGGRAASRLDRNQVHFAWNATMRGEHIHQRPAFLKRPLVYDTNWNCGYGYTPGYGYGTEHCGTVESNFRAGVFQGVCFYQAESGSNFLVAAVQGHLFKIDVLNGYKVTDISVIAPTGFADLNAPNILFTHFCQAEKYLIVQDGSALPIIFNGVVSRRALPDEIKTGTVMAYTNGRIWYATSPFTFRATDLVLGPSGTAAEYYRDAVLKETENDFLNEGGDFVVSQSSGGIKCMVAPAQMDTSLGQGPLQVFCANTVFSVNAPIERTQWKNVQYPLQTISQIDYGALGGRSVIPVNGDLFYRSKDGIRSFIVATRNFGDPNNGPISREVSSVLDDDTQSLLGFCSGAFFDRRLIFTCYPRYSEIGPVHRAMVVIDFDIATSMKQRTPATWEGVWTGLQTHQLVKGDFDSTERLFALCRSSAGYLQLWEVSRNEFFDNGTVRVNWGFETPSYSFGSSFQKKQLETAELFVSEVRGRVDFNVQYRPDHYPCWLPWHEWSECSVMETCATGEETCLAPKNLHPQYRTKMRLPQPAEDCNSPVKGLFRNLYECAYRFEIDGPAKVYQFRAKAIDQPEEPFGECRGSDTCSEIDCCLPELFDFWSAMGQTETPTTTDDTTGGGDLVDSPGGGGGGDLPPDDTTPGGDDTLPPEPPDDPTLPPVDDDDTLPGDTVPGLWGPETPRDSLDTPVPSVGYTEVFRSVLRWGWTPTPTQATYDTDPAWADQIDWHWQFFKDEFENFILLNGITVTGISAIGWETDPTTGYFVPAYWWYPAIPNDFNPTTDYTGFGFASMGPTTRPVLFYNKTP
jgi:hypothetical protein